MDWVSFDEIQKRGDATDGDRALRHSASSGERDYAPRPLPASDAPLGEEHGEFHRNPHQRCRWRMGMSVANRARSRAVAWAECSPISSPRWNSVPFATRRSNYKLGFLVPAAGDHPRAGWQGTPRGHFRGQGNRSRKAFQKKITVRKNRIEFTAHLRASEHRSQPSVCRGEGSHGRNSEKIRSRIFRRQGVDARSHRVSDSQREG